MLDLSFSEISTKLRNTEFPEIDLVLGIGTGGIVIASLVAHQLAKPLHLIKVNYRNVDNTIKYDGPVLLSEGFTDISKYKSVLLVDDVSVSGSTLSFVKSHLKENNITTFVLKGKNADIVLFPEISHCVNWPWKI